MLAKSLGIVALLAAFPCGAWADDKPAAKKGEPDESKNTVEIRRVGKDKVDIKVTSKKAFPVVNAYPVLSIGAETTSEDRIASPDGHFLVFTMSAKSFEKTKDGDAIRVRYEPDSQGVWEFGKLDKSKVKK
jgi:hypothetical protein